MPDRHTLLMVIAGTLPANGRTITMKRISDAILGALVQAMPDRS